MLNQWELKAPTDGVQSDCVHEQVAKADCECPFYRRRRKCFTENGLQVRLNMIYCLGVSKQPVLSTRTLRPVLGRHALLGDYKK